MLLKVSVQEHQLRMLNKIEGSGYLHVYVFIVQGPSALMGYLSLLSFFFKYRIYSSKFPLVVLLSFQKASSISSSN